MSETPPAFWLPLLWRGLAAFALGVPGFALNVWERSLDSETRFTPGLRAVQDVLYTLPLLSLGLVIVFMVRHAAASTRSFSRGQKLAWGFVVVVAQVVFAYAAMLMGAFTKPNWLFGPSQPYLTLPSPNGRRTAYATRECLFHLCSLDIHVQEGRALTMRRVRHLDRSQGGELSWRPDSSDVQVNEAAAGPTQ